jgi:hypothetical protein
MNGGGDRTQLTSALAVVVDHAADRVVERVMQLLELRLAERDAAAPRRAAAGADSPADGLGLMTLREAAAYLNRPLETVRYLAHRVRAFPIHHMGRGRGTVLVRKADLDALIKGESSRSDVGSAHVPDVKREKRSVLRRRCVGCGVLKPLTAFGRPEGGFDTECRRCRDAFVASSAQAAVVDLLETKRARVRRGEVPR